MKITLPENVEMIINTLTQAGYEAYAVGGCVRDSILGKSPKDWDITTSALPNTIKDLFPRTIDTGIQHGTVTVMIGKIGYEITTYRIDGEYEDSRHPKEVLFTSNLQLDLERRDFTINAMAYNHQNGLVDLFGGESDLLNGIIRCVGDANSRFQEDALRMMRAIRFSAQLNFSMDDSVNKAIKNLSEINLINYQTYGNITLTEKGTNLAKSILKRFDITKMFLTQILEVPEQQAQEDAKAIKTALSVQTEEKLEKYIIKILKLEDLECGCNIDNERCRSCARISAKNRLKK